MSRDWGTNGTWHEGHLASALPQAALGLRQRAVGAGGSDHSNWGSATSCVHSVGTCR